MRRSRREGFTLIEILMVVVIIGILVGILVPAIYGATKQAKRRRTQIAEKAILTAIQAYKTETGKWPCPEADQGRPDITYSNNNNLVMAILIGAYPPVIDISDFKTNANGCAVDYWDDYFRITIDTDYNGYGDGVVVDSPNV